MIHVDKLGHVELVRILLEIREEYFPMACVCVCVCVCVCGVGGVGGVGGAWCVWCVWLW